jgi:hypothetical protein
MLCPDRTKALPFCFSLGTALQMLGLALMAGGMLALGAVTAPLVFGNLPREMAAPLMAVIFRRYDLILLIALGLTLMGEALRIGARQMIWHPKRSMFRGFLLLGLTGMLLYSTTMLNPQIERYNRTGVHRNLQTAEGRQFEKAHKLSENVYKLSLLCAVLLILLTPFAGKPIRGTEANA